MGVNSQRRRVGLFHRGRRLKGVIRLRLVDMAALSGPGMTSWPEMQPMPNNLVNYGVTDNGIAIIELCSDSAVSYTHLTLPTICSV